MAGKRTTGRKGSKVTAETGVAPDGVSDAPRVAPDGVDATRMAPYAPPANNPTAIPIDEHQQPSEAESAGTVSEMVEAVVAPAKSSSAQLSSSASGSANTVVWKPVHFGRNGDEKQEWWATRVTYDETKGECNVLYGHYHRVL